MPTKLGTAGMRSITRPCECGLDLRPRRLFGFLMEPMDGAPCFCSGSLTLGGCGLPSTDRLADRFVAAMARYKGVSDKDATVAVAN
jgi:hypothetical protein